MEEPCSKKKDSNPPVCVVHNVPLVRKQLPAGMIEVGLKGFSFLACPVSGLVLNDELAHS